MKRSAMKPGKGFAPRSKPLRATAPAKAELPAKKRKCPVKKGGCGAYFLALKPKQIACMDCAAPVGAWLAASKAKTAHKEDVKQTRAKLEALKTIPQLKKEAQHAFNRFIRARDRRAGLPCVCCGRPLRWGVAGGAVDAGHFRSTGSADHLRYDEDNCHAQLSECNRFGAGRAVDYRLGIIARIGIERVEALESHSASMKWTRDGLRAIRDEYRAKARQLEKA